MSAQPSLWDLIQERLAQHRAAAEPAPSLGTEPGALVANWLGPFGLVYEAGRHVAGDVTGALYQHSSAGSDNPLDRRIADAGQQGGPAAALAAARTDPRKEVSLTAGALTELLNPVNYLGSYGKIGAVAGLGEAGRAADAFLGAPFAPAEYALGQVGRRAVAPAIQRAREALYGATEGVAGNVPKSAGLIGPVPPPPLRAPPPLVPGPTSILDLARGGVPPAEVARIAPLPEALAPTRAPSLLREALGARASIPAAVEHGPAIPESMVTPSIRGNVPKSARMGPFLPPVAPVAPLAPEQLREALGNLAARRMTTPPPEAVTAAQERALRPEVVSEPIAAASVAPGPPAQATAGFVETAPTTREAGLAALSGRDTNTLLSVAYDHPNAVANAQRKYADVGALRARAIERIQADRGRAARLAEADPDLAARVAALPDAEAAPIAATLAPQEAAQTATAGVPEAAPATEPAASMVPEAAPVAEAAPTTPAARRVAPPEVRDARAALKQAEADMAAVRNRPVSGDADYLDKVRDEAIARGRYNAARRATTVAETRWRNGVYDRGGEAPGVPGVPLVTPLAAARTLGPDVARGADKVLEALTGVNAADLATYGPEAKAYYRGVRQAEAQGISTEAQAREAGLPAYVQGARGPIQFGRDLLNQTRNQIVATFKNQVLDRLHTRFVVGQFAPEASDVGGTVVQIAADKRADRGARVASTVGSFLDGVMGPDASARYQEGLDLGEGLVGSLDEAGRALGTPRRELPAMQRRMNGVLIAAARTRGPVKAAAIPLGAVRGELDPLINEFFRTVNRFPQRIGREALFYLTAKANTLDAAGHLLARMADEGVDVTTLAGRYFSPEDVERVAGPEWANAWRGALSTVLGGAEAETKRVLGSFTEKTPLENFPLVGKMFWLAGWSTRMAPVYAQIAARHPGVSMAIGGALAGQARGLKAEGLPPWAIGGIDTPIGRVNPLTPLPFSGELAGEAVQALGGDEGEARTPYQTFEGIAGGLGLPVNPVVGTAAYIAGQTPKRPGDLDRYAGPTNALPGPTLPIDYGAMLDKARQIVTGLEAGDLAAGKKPPASEADKEFARLVYERTGLPLTDPRNIGAVIDSLADDPNTLAAKWRKEAEANVAGRQGKQGVVSAVSPLTVSRIDPLARQANIGRQNQPYSYEQISAAYDSGNHKAAALMQAANTASKAPDQRVYDAASEAQRLGLVKGFLAQQQAARRVPVSGDPYGLHNRPRGAGLP
jgi:hypothetical protein